MTNEETLQARVTELEKRVAEADTTIDSLNERIAELEAPEQSQSSGGWGVSDEGKGISRDEAEALLSQWFREISIVGYGLKVAGAFPSWQVTP